MRRFTLFAGWLIVVVLATTLTWQIVSAADDQVSERPIAPLNVAAPAITGGDTTTTTTLPESTTTIPTSTTTTSPGSSTSSSAATTSTSSATSATSQAATPTTAQPVAWSTRSVQTAGGTVILRYRPGEVSYQSATPAPGFKVDVEKPGPPEVKVEFESESKKIEIEASWSSGELDVHVSEGSDD